MWTGNEESGDENDFWDRKADDKPDKPNDDKNREKTDDPSDEDDGEGPYLWTAEDDACDECQDLDGEIFDEMPERPHPNCNCNISKYTDEDDKDEDKDKEPSKNPKEQKRRQRHKNKKKMKKAVKHLKENVKPGMPRPPYECAKYVNNALKAGGINIDKHKNTKEINGKPVDPKYASAYRYGGYLEKEGFKPIENYEHKDGDKYGKPKNYIEKKGDIVVFDKTEKHPDGHMAMYDGKEWKSDFNQNDMWGGSIRNENPSYKIYSNSR